ncbi:MAG: ABC transporter substrate-binding protein [Alphaproteobacteria bacterium]|nr:ABC transporter substrate-binding protein [Alphaproteobacteria bacterium]
MNRPIRWPAAAVAGAALALMASVPATTVQAQQMPKVVLAMSGWTGFAPLTLAEQAGLFKKNGVDVEIRFIPQPQRHLAVASGQVQAAATTVDTFLVWNAADVELTQVLLLDKSNGGDGIAVRSAINSFADLKGKTIAVDGPGTTPYFTLIYMLKRNGISNSDVKFVTLSPKDAATAFVAGQYDAAATYEPYLSQVRSNPGAGKILATTKDYPVVVDTLAFQPDYIKKNPTIVKNVIAGFFDALDMIKKEPAKSYEIMGKKVNLSGDQFKASAAFIAWQDKKANQEYFAKGLRPFMEYSANIQMQAGVIKKIPDLSKMMDDSFIK